MVLKFKYQLYPKKKKIKYRIGINYQVQISLRRLIFFITLILNLRDSEFQQIQYKVE